MIIPVMKRKKLKKKKSPAENNRRVVLWFVTVFENSPAFVLLLFCTLVFNIKECAKTQRTNADTAIKNTRQTIKPNSPRFRQLIFSFSLLTRQRTASDVDKKIVFDFVPPYNNVPKYKALQTKRPAFAGRAGEKANKRFLAWWCCLKVARTYFEGII
jgi:hypothetical protein